MANVQVGRKARRAAVSLALAAAVLVPSGSGFAERASAEGIASGTTRLELNRSLARALRKDGVRLSGVGEGRAAGRFVKLPVSGGTIDLPTASGSIESSGGVRFRAGRRSVKLTAVTLDTSRGAMLATLAGQKMKIAAVRGVELSRQGFGEKIDVAVLRLTRRASNLLNRKLRLDAFRSSRAFASATSSLQPDENRIVGGSFQLSFDPGTVAKIRSLDVELIPLESDGPATEPPVFADPLIQGEIDPTMARTWGTAEGGFRITATDVPSPSVDWWNLGYSFETGKLLSTTLAHTAFGQVAPAPPAPLASVDLSGATVSVDPASRTVTILGARATLEAGVADYINKTFALPQGKAPVLAAGDPLGTFSMTMQGR